MTRPAVPYPWGEPLGREDVARVLGPVSTAPPVQGGLVTQVPSWDAFRIIRGAYLMERLWSIHMI